MSRPYLDPASRDDPPVGEIVERLPERVRKFGRYPRSDRMQPGDLVLVCPVVDGFNSRLIQAFQSKSHTPFDSQWIHAAAYLGDHSLVEIDQGGVGVNAFHKYVGGHRIQVRRPLDLRGAPIGELTGYQVAVSALKMFKTTYNYDGLISIAARVLRAGGDFRLTSKSKAAICSDYYNDAVVRVLGRGAVSVKTNPFSPADLSASLNMIDIDVGWARLPG